MDIFWKIQMTCTFNRHGGGHPWKSLWPAGHFFILFTQLSSSENFWYNYHAIWWWARSMLWIYYSFCNENSFLIQPGKKVLTRVLESNRKAAYRCNKGRLENKFSYLALNFATFMVLRSYRITTMLSRDPICLLAVFTQNPVCSSPIIQKKSSSEVKFLAKEDQSYVKWRQTKLGVGENQQICQVLYHHYLH